MSDTKNCVEIIKKCIEDFFQCNFDKLNFEEKCEQLDKLRFFRMDNLKNCEECYGDLSPHRFESNYKFDGDNTELAKAVMFLYYKNYLPGIYRENKGKYSTIKCKDGPYRPDTMNSLNTLFKEEEIGGKWQACYKFENEKLDKKKLEDFYTKFQTIGNFILLPNLSIARNATLNTRRSCAWRDYFDKFLYEIRLCFLNKENPDINCNLDLLKLMEVNNFYFNAMTFEKFCRINLLDDYLTKHGEVSFFYEKDIEFRPVHWYNIDEEKYIDFVNSYLDSAIKIIDNRSKKIIEEIQLYF